MKTSWIAAALFASMAGGPVLANSTSSVSLNGKAITVSGAQSQSVSAANGVAIIAADDLRIMIDGETLTMDGRSVDLGPFRMLDIQIINGEPSITVDGELIMLPSKDDSDL